MSNFFDYYQTQRADPYAQQQTAPFNPYVPTKDWGMQGSQLPGTPTPNLPQQNTVPQSPNAQAEQERQERDRKDKEMAFVSQFMSQQAPDMSQFANAGNIMSQVQALGSGQPEYQNFMPQHRDPYIQKLTGG
ncbi:MAG: hypothetical protein COB23_07145 [Methylophaga sp.]|nr:MAG: hypothetical protein COB23_07145 [Methylophaga sp.]